MYHVGSVWSHFAWIRWSQSEFPPEYEGGLRGDVKLKTVGQVPEKATGQGDKNKADVQKEADTRDNRKSFLDSGSRTCSTLLRLEGNTCP